MYLNQQFNMESNRPAFNIDFNSPFSPPSSRRERKKLAQDKLYPERSEGEGAVLG